MDFHNKVAIVTGGASGIGRACALALARDGAAVVVADKDGPTTRALVEGMRSWGGRAIACVADVTVEQDAARIANETVAAFDGIDILVNNAGIQPQGTVETTSLETWNATLAVNLTGIYLVSHYVIPEMRRRGGGSIVNVSSIHGLVTAPNMAAYAASKGGVIALSRTMALDFASEGIRVNCVCPGVVDTPMLREAARLASAGRSDETLKQWQHMQPLGRLGTPEEVAEMIVFLASPRASFITGSVYSVDGGLGARF
ncbi:MAG: SDR family oxidoreductase [Chloroflexaceae bacterium]|nr:SDR family oxidoreductase [Chloroflexaceae bacterium]